MKLFYRTYGHGKPLLILHGLFGMSDNWMTLAKQFGENGFAVYAVDLRNHGQSPHSVDFSYDLMTDDVDELMNDLKLNAASVIGHSMGAKVAILLALRHPEKIEKLIVADMAPRQYPLHHGYIFSAIHEIGDLTGYSSRKDVENKIAQSIGIESTRQFLLKNLYWKKTDGGEELAWRFNLPVLEKNIEKMGEAVTSKSSFNKPALFIKGEKSNYITSNDEEEIKQLFPRAIIKTITGAGHWVHADKQKEFFDAAIAFLK